MKIGARPIGPEQRPFIIAEIAQGHDGSLGNALAFIDAAKACGADAVKYQTHIASEESTPNEPWRVPFSRQDATRYAYWERMEFSFEHWRLLKQRADEVGIAFMSSPFSIKACEWLRELEVPAWKLASGEVHNAELVDWVSAAGKPVILSSGLSSAAEAVTMTRSLRDRGVDVALLHCTSRYPTPANEVGLNILSHYMEALEAPVGLSDHSGTVYPAIVATYLGASILEVHLAWHEGMFGPDTSSALTPQGLSDLVKGVDFAFRMRTGAADKNDQLSRLSKERSIFGRSLVAETDIAAGTILQGAHLSYKKPGGGLTFEDRERLVGRRVRTHLPKDHPFAAGDVE